MNRLSSYGDPRIDGDYGCVELIRAAAIHEPLLRFAMGLFAFTGVPRLIRAFTRIPCFRAVRSIAELSSVVACFRMFRRIFGDPDSKPHNSQLKPASLITSACSSVKSSALTNPRSAKVRAEILLKGDDFAHQRNHALVDVQLIVIEHESRISVGLMQESQLGDDVLYVPEADLSSMGLRRPAQNVH